MDVLSYPDPVVDTADLQHEDWLEFRQRGIGGSDAAAVLGISPWKSAYRLWVEKTSPVVPNGGSSPAMAYGSGAEGDVADHFSLTTGLTIANDTHLYAHPDHPHMLANLDRLVLDEITGLPVSVLEIKTSGREWWRVPPYYESQIQHYMAVTGLPHAYCAVYYHDGDLSLPVVIDPDRFAIFEVPRNEAFIDLLVEQEAGFWAMVERHVAPPIDGSPSTHDVLRKMYTSTGGKVTNLRSEIVELIERRNRAKAAIAQQEDEVREIESQIMAELKDAEGGVVDGDLVVTWKTQRRTSLDQAALKKAHPDLAEQFAKSSEYRVLRFPNRASEVSE